MSGNTQKCEIFDINSNSSVSGKLQPTPHIGLLVDTKLDTNRCHISHCVFYCVNITQHHLLSSK